MESGTVQASVGAINGASANERDEHLEIHNPATGGLIATVPVDSPQAVAETVARVRANQPEWEALGIEGRYRWLGKLRDWLLDNADRVLDTMQAETGKVRADASNEPAYLADLINFYGAKASKFIGEQSIRPHTPLLAAEEAARSSTAPIRWSGSSAPGTFRWSWRWATRSRRCRRAPRW